MKVTGQTFSQAPKPRFHQGSYESPPVRLLYDLREMTEHAHFFSWPLTEAVRLVAMVRDEVAERLKKSLQNQAEPIERVFGRRRDATEADKASRIRIVPLPSIGHHHADHSIRRLLVEIPPNCPLATDDVAWAFSGFRAVDQTTGEILWVLVPAEERTMLNHYAFGGDIGDRFRLWRAVTPIHRLCS